MQINSKEEVIKRIIEEVIKFKEIEFDYEIVTSFKNEFNVSIEIDYIKSNVARDYLSEIKSKLINCGHNVGYCSLSSYGERGIHSSNSINNISFTVIY